MKKYVYINMVCFLLIAIFIHFKIISVDAIKIFTFAFFALNIGFLKKMKKNEKSKQ